MKWMILVFAFSSLTAACAGPCEELANAICNCEDEAASVLACKNQVSSDAKNVKPTEADNRYCSSKLKSCTCAKLAKGDRAACGLTRE